jgi:hypothetical protein
MELNEFLPLYREDDNRWWLLSAGDMQNLFDEAIERAEALGTQLAAVRQALGGSENSNPVSLAAFVAEALSSSERELEQARDYVDDAIGYANPAVPLVDRIVRMVSVLATGTTPAEVDANEGRATVDEMARRVDYLEIALTGDADRYGNLVRRVEALEAKSL